MIKIGEYNKLRAVRQTDNGVYFTDKEETAEALLPNKFIPDELFEDDILELFVFKDHENRLTATTQEPKITLNKFAFLQVVDVNDIGAFLDWGLEKDLLVPYREQPTDLIEGHWYIVFLYLDDRSGRLVATARYLNRLKNRNVDLKPGDEVELLIDNETDLGRNVIVNHRFKGLIFKSDIFQELERGMTCKGYVKAVRAEGKIDISLEPTGVEKISANAQKILAKLEESENGFLPLTDKSDPALIRKELQMSKKTFKQALGGLYKRRMVRLEKDGVYLQERAEA
ncbi:MAG TPA: S1 RNA-binding domain-containing protein [Bacteroidetes bacterium]|nr:S1 RNA-binding domain-containing protein [Bacteroidota bacterium]